MWETQLRQNSVDVSSSHLHAGFYSVHTDSVDNLMDHNLTELKLFMLLIPTKILSDHRNAFPITVHTSSSVQGIAVVIISIQSTDARRLAETPVSLSTSLVVLIAKIEWLEEEQDRDLDNGDENQEDLNRALAGVQLSFDRSGRQEHVD